MIPGGLSWADAIPVPVAPALLHPLDPQAVREFLLAGLDADQAARELALVAAEEAGAA